MESCSRGVYVFTRWLVILGALVGGVGASRTARELVRGFPRQAREWARARWRSVRRRWLVAKAALRELVRKLGSWLRRLINGALVHLRLRKHRTFVGKGTTRMTLDAVIATGAVRPPPMEQRVENLEAWRRATTEDQRFEAHWIILGFFLIAAGELIGLLAC